MPTSALRWRSTTAVKASSGTSGKCGGRAFHTARKPLPAKAATTTSHATMPEGSAMATARACAGAAVRASLSAASDTIATTSIVNTASHAWIQFSMLFLLLSCS